MIDNLLIQIRDAMLTRSAHLDHRFQLPLGMERAGPEIVKLIKSSKLWKV